MDISIIIPTKNRNTILKKTVEHVCEAVKDVEAEIIIVNDSKINKVEIDKQNNNIYFFDNPGNGVSSARNFGASVAKAELLLFLDDDMLIFEENIKTVLMLHNRFPGIVFNLNSTYPPELLKQCQKLQFGRYLIRYGFTSLRGWGGGEQWKEWNDAEMFEVDTLAAFFLPISKSIFNKIGGFDERILFPAEDYDFSVKLKNNNMGLYIYPKSIIHHNEADRIDIKSWLERKKVGGHGHKVAVKFGYNEFKKPYSCIKVVVHKLIFKVRNIMFIILNLIPNIKLLDFIYFRIVNRLLGAYIYTGYTE